MDRSYKKKVYFFSFLNSSFPFIASFDGIFLIFKIFPKGKTKAIFQNRDMFKIFENDTAISRKKKLIEHRKQLKIHLLSSTFQLIEQGTYLISVYFSRFLVRFWWYFMKKSKEAPKISENLELVSKGTFFHL